MTSTQPNAMGSAGSPATEASCTRFTWQSADGLTLSGCKWPARAASPSAQAGLIPVLCLPGLSRNTRDFNDIASFLQGRGHDVYALDYRGRGKSDWDPDWRNYALQIEEKDIDAAIEHLGLDRFALLGTSRGGLHAMSMALRYPKNRMAGVIFNDVGPRIEMGAIQRIAATLGRTMKFASKRDVSSALERLLGAQFPSFQPEDWEKLASQLATEQDGELVLDYDPAIARQFASMDDATPIPDLWHLFENLTDRPVLVVRGEHSDLLSDETCRRMKELHPDCELSTVSGQGHAPALWDRDSQEKIADFLERLA